MKLLGWILASVALGGAGQLLLRVGMKRAGAEIALNAADLGGWLQVVTDPRVLGGLTLWVISTALWLLVLARAELSYAYCLGSMNYVLVPLAARVLLAESVSTARLVGMGLIFLGVAVTLYSKLLESTPSP